MAAKTKCQNVSELRKTIRKCEITSSELETSDFIVLCLERYLRDPKHGCQIGQSADREAMVDVIQVTLADSNHKMKALLAPPLNRLAQTNKLRGGSTVCVTSARLRYDETDMTGNSIVIIEALTFTGFVEEPAIVGLDKVSWCTDYGHLEQIDAPLTSSRGYFTSLWSSMEMEGSVWQTSVPTHDSLGLTPQEVYTIKDMKKKNWQVVKAKNPVLLVRVILKSRILHYAKPDKNDKWPLQAHLVVADSTGACTAVLWNAMCPRLYFAINEGKILLLRNFTVKPSYQSASRFKQTLPQLDLYNIDLNLNSHHPLSEVKLIEEDAVPKDLKIPALSYTFVNRQQAGCLPDNFICDIIGVVTYVGSYERELMANKFGHDSGGFWVRQWLHLQDDSSSKPFIVQFYRMAEGLESKGIKPGHVLMCTHMRIVQHISSIETSRTHRHVFLTTTAETQVTIVDAAMSSVLTKEPVVEHVWQWSQSSGCTEMVNRSLVGGYFSYPPLPSTVAGVREFLTDTPVLPSEDWERVLTGLSYREGRQLIVQATIVHAALHIPGSHRNRSRSGKSPSKRRKSDPFEVTLDPDLYGSDQSFTSLGSGQLDGDSSIPVIYTSDQWSVIKHRLQFPTTNIIKQSPIRQDDAVELDTVLGPYFTITWVGLNNRILLKSHLLCPHNVTETTQIMDIMAGRGFLQNPSFVSEDCPLTDTQLHTVLLTARQCVDNRFMLVLDCYQQDSYVLDIFLNRGLPVSGS